jgi:ABC-2 type transport system permease protein
MRTVWYLVQKEALQVLRDRVMLFQILAIPMVQLLIVTSAATFEVRQAGVHLVDADRTETSREIADAFRASEQFRIRAVSASSDAAEVDLDRREADLIVQIPLGFEEAITRGETPNVRLVVSGQTASAGIIQSYAAQILQQAGVETRSSGSVPPASPARLSVQSRLWYNATLEYDDFMAPGVLTILVTLIATLLTAQNIARERERGTIEQLNVTPITKRQFIAGKLLPFWILGLLEFAVGLGIARAAFGIPMEGSLGLLFAATGVYLIVALGVGLWISTIVDTQQQAMFITFFVMMLYLFMSGLFTPVASMPAWAEWLAELSPLKHFIEVVRGILMKGTGLDAVWQEIGLLAGYGGLILSVAIRQYTKTSA